MKTPPTNCPAGGFALVITLSLMVLLTIVVVGLLTLSSVALRSTSQHEAMATARNNARLALMLAIGELQKTLGPDKAISATSGILAAAPAKPNTTGVWESWDFNPNGGPLKYDEEKTTRFRRWLVSSADPQALESRDFATAAWAGDTIELVGDASLGGKAEASAKVVAGRVPVLRDGKVQGAMAWHVADESVKARINLYRDPSQNATLAQKRALLAGQRPDSSVIKAADNSPLDFLPTDDTAAHFVEAGASSGKITGLEQVDLLENAKGRIKQFRNDVTSHSLGLLTDVRRGGLKQDLSSVFEMNTALPAEFSGKKLYQSTHGISGVSDPYWSALSAYYNVFRNVINPETNPTFSKAPAQDTLLTNLAPPTGYFPGPVIAKIETLFSFVIRDSHSCWVSALSDSDPQLQYMAHVVYTPLITLHNPYNISISFDSMEVIIRNVPIAFRFYVNNKPQNNCLVPLTEMFVNDSDRGEKSFALKIANWASPSSTSPTGVIVMKPGQTLVCSPYLEPSTTFSSGEGIFFDYQNDLTGYKIRGGTTTVSAIKAKPGFYGRCVGFDIDWIVPGHSTPALGQLSDPSQSTHGNVPVLGLRASDAVYMEYAVRQPSLGLNTAFEVTAKLTSNGTTKKYGGLNFQYQDAATLQKLLPKTYRYPNSGTISKAQAYVPNTDPIKNHASAKTVAVFSAYARTANGGVYETKKRTLTNGSLNELKDGRLAGKPFLFHNPARTVVTMDLKKEKPGAHSHELNFQQFVSSGAFEDYLTLDVSNRSPYLTGNKTSTGIKSGSYLELPVGPLQTLADFRRSNALTSFYLPNFVQPVGNSQVSPLMSTAKVSQTDAAVAAYALLDHSVLANHALYDRFYFSTFATSGKVTPETVFSEFMEGKRPLASQAFQPYLPAGKTVSTAKEELYSSVKPTNTAYQKAAEYQMIRGAFNVNSTSVQAWKAMLASLNKTQVVTLWAKSAGLESKASTGTPILGMSLLNGGSSAAAVEGGKIDNALTNEWNGYRELAEPDLELLAEKIVDQVRRRGPFLSMSEFVNRQVGVESELTRSGALEEAITQAKINDKSFTTQVPITPADVSNTTLYDYKTPLAAVGNPAAGAPGWVSQGDLLRILEPAATVRSDTFVIRVCGEAQDASGKVSARAYAEAVVQRLPEYVDPIDRPSLNVYTDAKASVANKNFGRRMNVVLFRWLASDEI